MQRVISALGRAFRNCVLVVTLTSLIGFTDLWTIAVQPAQAASNQQSAQEVISPDSQSYATREEAYEKAVEAVKDPEGLEKEYQKDLKIYKQENPGEGGLIEGAKEAIDKLTEKPELVKD